MEVNIVEEKIDDLKPKMKTMPSFKALEIIEGDTIIMSKADGEFTKISYSNSEGYTLNRWGKMRTDFPALNNFIKAMNDTGVESAELLCELYAMKEDKPLKLPDFIHYMKGGDPELVKQIHMGFFDLISINDQPVNQNYAWKLDEISRWVKDCELCHVLPYIKPKTVEDIEKFWEEQVKQNGYEGVVSRSNHDTYKVKPISDLDAVIIGINKRDLFWTKKVTSIRVALMNENGEFIEVGDCASGITHDLRTKLWQLMDYKIAEDSKVVWIKPMVICTIEYTDLFKGKNKVLSYNDSMGYVEKTTTDFVRFKSPRLIGFRPDKRVSPDDLRMEQVPLSFWKDIWAIAKELSI